MCFRTGSDRAVQQTIHRVSTPERRRNRPEGVQPSTGERSRRGEVSGGVGTLLGTEKRCQKEQEVSGWVERLEEKVSGGGGVRGVGRLEEEERRRCQGGGGGGEYP